MEFQIFKNPKRLFAISLFIQQNDLQKNIKELETLGNQRNVKLVVQPCPYEGIEFLYRVNDNLIGHFFSLEKEVFWEAIELKEGTSKSVMDSISEAQLEYLTAILEQNTMRVKQAMLKFKSYDEYLIKPLSVE